MNAIAVFVECAEILTGASVVTGTERAVLMLSEQTQARRQGVHAETLIGTDAETLNDLMNPAQLALLEPVRWQHAPEWVQVACAAPGSAVQRVED